MNTIGTEPEKRPLPIHPTLKASGMGAREDSGDSHDLTLKLKQDGDKFTGVVILGKNPTNAFT